MLALLLLAGSIFQWLASGQGVNPESTGISAPLPGAWEAGRTPFKGSGGSSPSDAGALALARPIQLRGLTAAASPAGAAAFAGTARATLLLLGRLLLDGG